MERKAFQIGLALFVVGCVLFLALTLLERQTQAQGGGTIYVAPDGDCGGMLPCYAHPQDAVDAASNGDTIKMAQGVYTGTGFQVVYINRAITLTGGYTTTDWANSYPITQPTMIDAENVTRRQGVVIDGTRVATITLAGLTIQRGNAGGTTKGSGLNILTGTVVVSTCTFVENMSADRGGGIHLTEGDLLVTGSSFVGNVAGGGGGIHIEDGAATVISSTFSGNNAYFGGSINATILADLTVRHNIFSHNVGSYGGGIMTESGYGIPTTKVIEYNVFEDNSAYYAGGGAEVRGSAIVKHNTFRNNSTGGPGGGANFSGMCCGEVNVAYNTFFGNSASSGGGLSLSGSFTGIMEGNIVLSNTATQSGGGLFIPGGEITAQNDVIAHNEAPYEGIFVTGGARLTARHWTLDDNGAYALCTDGGTATLTNTIVASHTIAGFWGTNIVADHTLFFNSGTPCGGGASCTNNLTGDPKFVNPAGGDYHIGPGSAAIDVGVDAGVTDDIDGDMRPQGAGYDVGADEYRASTPCILFGDLDGDGDVDVDDIMQVAGRWRTSCDNPDPDNNPDTPNYEARYDLDDDGDIDIVDIMLVVAHWGETCP